MARNCIVCDAFPDHTGAHYSARDVTSRLFALRVRGPSGKQWAELPNCLSAQGNPIMASATLPESPDAHAVGSCWLCEHSPELEPDPVPEPAPQPAAAEEDNGRRGGLMDAVRRISDRAPADSPDEGETTMATDDAPRGALEWSPSGLQVDLRSAGSNGHSTPGVEHLKSALRNYSPPQQVQLSLTETLGSGEAWVTVSAGPKAQGALLICAGHVIEHLVEAGVYSEVAVNDV